MIDRKAEIQRRVNLSAYIDKIECLTGNRPTIEEMTSPQFVAEMRKNLSDNLKLAPVSTKAILFAEIRSSRFASLIADLESRNPNPIFIWIEAANGCGFVKPIKLCDFQFDFEFDRIPEGIITLITSDARDKLLMDFEEDDDGTQIMTIELHGAGWGKAKIKHLTSLEN
jgi:hypothetical protein